MNNQEIIQANEKLSSTLEAFLNTYSECTKVIEVQISKNTSEIAPFVEALGNPLYGYRIIEEGSKDMPLPPLMNNLVHSNFHARFAPQRGLMEPLKEIYAKYGLKSDGGTDNE